MTLLNAVAAVTVAVRISRIQIVAPVMDAHAAVSVRVMMIRVVMIAVMVIAVVMIVTVFVVVYEHRFIILAMENSQ
jgi:hypothetical protein